MIEVLLRPEAEVDIEELADYTLARWGREQALAYVATVRAGLRRLAEASVRFPIHEPSGLGLRRMRSGHHFVYFGVADRTIDLVRVLHERQDPTRHMI